jgi:hypothetical protein
MIVGLADTSPPATAKPSMGECCAHRCRNFRPPGVGAGGVGLGLWRGWRRARGPSWLWRDSALTEVLRMAAALAPEKVPDHADGQG